MTIVYPKIIHRQEVVPSQQSSPNDKKLQVPTGDHGGQWLKNSIPEPC
jgi:hypothetical protein